MSYILTKDLEVLEVTTRGDLFALKDRKDILPKKDVLFYGGQKECEDRKEYYKNMKTLDELFIILEKVAKNEKELKKYKDPSALPIIHYDNLNVCFLTGTSSYVGSYGSQDCYEDDYDDKDIEYDYQIEDVYPLDEFLFDTLVEKYPENKTLQKLAKDDPDRLYIFVDKFFCSLCEIFMEEVKDYLHDEVAEEAQEEMSYDDGPDYDPDDYDQDDRYLDYI